MKIIRKLQNGKGNGGDIIIKVIKCYQLPKVDKFIQESDNDTVVVKILQIL